MKKFLTSFAVVALCSLSANAQNTTATTTNKAPKPQAQNWDSFPADQKMQAANKEDLSIQEKIEKRDQNSAKWQDSSAEEKQKMVERRQKFENMSPEEREKMKAQHQERKGEREEKYNNASPEQKARMDKRHAIMEKLTPDQRKAAKAEMERHRAAMKQITGVDMAPPAPEGNN